MSTETQQILDEKVKQTWVPLYVNLGAATLKMKDIISLKKGDIIKLETDAKDDLLVTIENKPMFYGKVGTKGQEKSDKDTRL